MKKSTAPKVKANRSAKPKTLSLKRETIKDLTPQGQHVKGGGPHCTGCTWSR